MNDIKKDNRIEYHIYEYDGKSFPVDTYDEALSFWEQGKVVLEYHASLWQIDEWTIVETVIQREWH